MLAAVKWTAGVGPMNCVTYNEVEELLAASVVAGNVHATGNTALSGRLASPTAEYPAENYRRAVGYLDGLISQTTRPALTRRRTAASLTECLLSS